MLSLDIIYKALIDNKINFFAGVPDSLLKDFCAYISDNVTPDKHFITANEGAALSMGAGYHLATGEIPLVYMQNSGLGNVVNPLLSLVDEKVYSIPALLLIGWRGEPGVKDEPQHVKQGEVTLGLLEAMRIPSVVLSQDTGEAVSQLKDGINRANADKRPYAIIIRTGTFEKYTKKNKIANPYPLSREEALAAVISQLGDKDVVVSTTGKLSRELFELREKMGQSHRSDLLTVGSMGYSSSIALGIALAKKERNVFCLDGDGALLMHMGALSNIGNSGVTNFKHIVFNNGAHESVGGQPTLGFNVDFLSICKACGYKAAFIAEKKEDIISYMEKLKAEQGPVLLEIRVNLNSRDDLGRPTISPVENKADFMNYLKE